ncbi:response regulator [Mucilaginibacter sp. JRF]|uniref:PAS domain-containing hybrid sensor histidine kinase/response regulator n=1 Tax=Mucilaginibacter sp. JRF TaxID=2780088 RepID=UPI00187F00A2|nr:PAS domain-containing hybrid sensor histidine kinase/response regulator [Mucilaginibacter sp. JRF]MBE9583410.1 response regulator [Mucilaginibacter sp. JRF]
MSLNSRLVLLIHNDRSIYRLLLLVLCIASPALYFLCHKDYADPLYIRMIGSATCIAAIGLSFVKSKIYFRLSLYVTIITHLVVNNYLLLSSTQFSPLYIFGSLVIFMGLAFLCIKQYEFVAITAINLALVLTAYINTPNHNITTLWLSGLLAIFTASGYIIFIVRMVYRLRFKKAVDNLTKTNNSLKLSEQKLRDSRNQLHSLINSINDIVFEIHEDGHMLNVWYNEQKTLHFDPKVFFQNKLTDVVNSEKAAPLIEVITHVINDHQPKTIEFRSIFGVDKWFSAKITPVHDRQGKYTKRVSVAVTDITNQKNYEQALQNNQDLLLEAQSIAKMANWWFDANLNETYWSPNAYKMLEIKGIPDGLTHEEYYQSRVHPDDLTITKNFIQNLGLDGRKTFEHKIVTAKGNLKYIKIICGETSLNDDGSLKRVSGIIQDITEIRLSEKSAKISRAELIEAQTIAKIGNWKNEQALDRFSWSDEIANIYEIEKKHVALKNFVRLFFKHVHPDDRELLHKLLKTPSSAVGRSFEYRIIGTDGTIKHLSLIIGKVMRRDGVLRKIIGTLQDVTERKKAELEFERTKNKYQLVLEGIKLVALTVDRNGIVTFCNSHLAGILGCTPADVVGLNWINTFVPEQFRNTLNVWLDGTNYESHYINPIICKDGKEAIISWQNTMSFDEHGALIEITSLGEDITDRQKATQELITAKEDAERSSKFQSDFLSTMSHEIRTPMNAVIGITNLLLADSPRPEQLEYLHTLKFSGDNLLAIINDILDYNKIEAGKFELIKHPVNLKQLTQNIWQTFLPRAAQQGIELKLITDSEIPGLIMADQVRLSQILNNLIGNSIKFTHKGNVTIKVDKTTEDDNTTGIRFTISDTGIGIAPKSLPDIFDPFVQDMHHQNTFGGTGLGLAITKRLVNLHNGSIDVVSELNSGTKFTIDIVFEAVADTGHDAQNKPAPAPSQDLSDIHILVVDDNKMNLLIASKFLKKWKANVDEAINGQMAVDLTNTKAYSMIIMDLQMPVMDGFEATRIIKRTHPHIPIIALTADAMPDTYNKAFEAGMDDYLTKPFLPETLFEKVSKHRNMRGVSN